MIAVGGGAACKAAAHAKSPVGAGKPLHWL